MQELLSNKVGRANLTSHDLLRELFVYCDSCFNDSGDVYDEYGGDCGSVNQCLHVNSAALVDYISRDNQLKLRNAKFSCDVDPIDIYGVREVCEVPCTVACIDCDGGVVSIVYRDNFDVKAWCSNCDGNVCHVDLVIDDKPRVPNRS